MPADEDYGRRHSILQHSAASPAPAISNDRYQAASPADRFQQERTVQNEKSAPSVERLDPPERFQSVSERFNAERSGSDRLPSGERYQGVSERYPLGDCTQTTVSTERLAQAPNHCHSAGDRTNFPPDRYQHSERSQKYSDRFTPIQNIGSLDRYHNHATPIDRYSRTNTPTDRYHTLYTDKERCSSSADRYTPVEKYPSNDTYNSTERHSSQNVNTLGRHTPTERHRRNQNERDQYFTNAVPQNTDVYKRRERSRSSERKPENFQAHNENYTRYGHEHTERYSTDRFPTIPCPERFATQERTERPERITFSQVPYMAPPSPAPASDRFIPPPPLSPTNTPSPDCYASNTFPSPTNSVPPPERFVPPPPLSPSPTETFSPKKQRERYPDRFSNSSSTNDRYSQYQQERYKDRGPYYSTSERYPAPHQTLHTLTDRYVNVHDRFNNGERTTVPPNPHAPVERYTPQQQEPYYQYDRYPKYNATNINSSDPYMRRDLAYQHQFRVAVPFQQNPYQRIRYMGTPSRTKCCQYQDCYQLCKSSPCSSSSSSVTSQGKEIQKELISNSNIPDVQCQNINGYQQEKAIQCNNFPNKEIQCPGFHITTRTDKKDVTCAGYVSPNLRTGKIQCRHGVCSSPSVEYVGQSGGRHVCATPPPRGSIGSVDGSVCSDQCCIRRSQNTLAVTVWRSTPTPQQQPQATTQQQQQQQPQQQQQIQQPSPQQQQQPAVAQPSPQVTATKTPPPINISEPPEEATEVVTRHEQQPLNSQPSSPPKQTAVPRAISLPTSPGERYRNLPAGEHRLDYSQSERLPNRPKLARSISRKEAIKNFVKKETANFFGVEEGNQNDQQLRWLDRRKRLASRTYGPLKAEYRIPSGGLGHRRAVSEITGVQTIPGRISGWRPDVLPGPSDVPDSVPEYRPSATVKRKESVARMTWDGLSYVITTLTRHRPRLRSQVSQQSRSFPPGTSAADIPLEDDVFFERPPTSPGVQFESAADEVDAEQLEQSTQKSLEAPLRYTAVPGWKRTQHVVRSRGEHQREVGGNRIFSSLLDSVLDNSDRRQYGMGWVGRMFGRSMRRSVAQDEDIQQQLDDMEDHRPMFTYWVTTVQILVLIISLICYGFGPFGIDMRSRSGQVLVPSLSLQQVDYMEPANFWFGPRAADLIHLGAKFAPCMRVDDKIQQQIEKTRTKERETACCIRNDDSGCVQSSRADCSNTISTWKKWTPRDAGPGGRISGSVCGLDPKYCDAPASVHPYEWPDDITKWPICRKTNMQFSIQKQQGSKDKSAEHMICEVIGHPCCIGIHGTCKITTKEYCDFVRGTFHEEASLCSQVSCLDNVCGMVPFYFPEIPDQFYRLWTSLFLHAGILQLLVTVVIQYFLMRDLEKLTGSLRTGIIYIGSGIAGNLASAIFVPYRADVGPSGSHFGLLACLIVEVLNAWPMLKHPNQALCKLLSITLFLFVIGLMPWVDNYAHLFGFVFGFLLSYALLPFITFGPYDRQKKIVLIWVCLLSAAFLFICLMLLFYIIPVYDCEVCSYFNCLPITRDFCASQNINFKREEYIV